MFWKNILPLTLALKRYLPTSPHGVATHKTKIDIINAVRTSDLMLERSVLKLQQRISAVPDSISAIIFMISNCYHDVIITVIHLERNHHLMTTK
jgi:hypothetical protein